MKTYFEEFYETYKNTIANFSNELQNHCIEAYLYMQRYPIIKEAVHKKVKNFIKQIESYGSTYCGKPLTYLLWQKALLEMYELQKYMGDYGGNNCIEGDDS